MDVNDAGGDAVPGATAQGRPSDQDSGSTVGRDALAALFSNLARSLEQEEDSEATLRRVVRSAIAMIPGIGRS